MLYSDKRYDISEQILRTILRSNNQKQIDSRREKKKINQGSIVAESEKNDRKDVDLEIKKLEAEEKRKEILTEREAKKLEAEEKRKEILAEREAKKLEAEEKRNKKIKDNQKFNM